MSYVYVLLTILLTVYGQVVIKWQVAQAGPLPAGAMGKVQFLSRLLLNPWVVSALAAALLAALSWMAALTKLDLGFAYPFMSLAFVLVLVLSSVVLHETVTPGRMIGMALIVAGLIVASRG